MTEISTVTEVPKVRRRKEGYKTPQQGFASFISLVMIPFSISRSLQEIHPQENKRRVSYRDPSPCWATSNAQPESRHRLTPLYDCVEFPPANRRNRDVLYMSSSLSTTRVRTTADGR